MGTYLGADEIAKFIGTYRRAANNRNYKRLFGNESVMVKLLITIFSVTCAFIRCAIGLSSLSAITADANRYTRHYRSIYFGPPLHPSDIRRDSSERAQQTRRSSDLRLPCPENRRSNMVLATPPEKLADTMNQPAHSRDALCDCGCVVPLCQLSWQGGQQPQTVNGAVLC